MTLKRRHSLPPGDVHQQDKTSRSTLPTKKSKSENPRKPNGRFVKTKKRRANERSSTAQTSSPTSPQDDNTTLTNSAQPANVSISSATQQIPAPVETLSLPSSSTPGEERMEQNQRISAIVSWLKYTRTYDQNEHLVHPFNLPPPARIRPVAMYQHQYIRNRSMTARLARLPPEGVERERQAFGRSERAKMKDDEAENPGKQI